MVGNVSAQRVEDRLGVVGRAIVDDDDLIRQDGLRADAGDGIGDVPAIVVGRDDDADRGHPPAGAATIAHDRACLFAGSGMLRSSISIVSGIRSRSRPSSSQKVGSEFTRSEMPRNAAASPLTIFIVEGASASMASARLADRNAVSTP